ncbi:hypothetical protein SMALB_3481 [Streptomyces malaysiensis]|uniref:Uncharacterized protein n=1 Tax=Streptomyces malaysiensis TaxID=92644 RepID=A0A7X5X417_STRMQ|nr:hypothetical protein [Streptomyces malaysiensis]
MVRSGCGGPGRVRHRLVFANESGRCYQPPDDSVPSGNGVRPLVGELCDQNSSRPVSTCSSSDILGLLPARPSTWSTPSASADQTPNFTARMPHSREGVDDQFGCDHDCVGDDARAQPVCETGAHKVAGRPVGSNAQMRECCATRASVWTARW